MKKFLVSCLLALSSAASATPAFEVPEFDRDYLHEHLPDADVDRLQYMQDTLTNRTPEQWREFVLKNNPSADPRAVEVCYEYCTTDKDGNQTCHKICVGK